MVNMAFIINVILFLFIVSTSASPFKQRTVERSKPDDSYQTECCLCDDFDSHRNRDCSQTRCLNDYYSSTRNLIAQCEYCQYTKVYRGGKWLMRGQCSIEALCRHDFARTAATPGCFGNGQPVEGTLCDYCCRRPGLLDETEYCLKDTVDEYTKFVTYYGDVSKATPPPVSTTMLPQSSSTTIKTSTRSTQTSPNTSLPTGSSTSASTTTSTATTTTSTVASYTIKISSTTSSATTFPTTVSSLVCSVCDSTSGNNCNDKVSSCLSGKCQNRITYDSKGSILHVVKSCVIEILCRANVQSNVHECNGAPTNTSQPMGTVCSYCCAPTLTQPACNTNLFTDTNIHAITTEITSSTPSVTTTYNSTLSTDKSSHMLSTSIQSTASSSQRSASTSDSTSSLVSITTSSSHPSIFSSTLTSISTSLVNTSAPPGSSAYVTNSASPSTSPRSTSSFSTSRNSSFSSTKAATTSTSFVKTPTPPPRNSSTTASFVTSSSVTSPLSTSQASSTNTSVSSRATTNNVSTSSSSYSTTSTTPSYPENTSAASSPSSSRASSIKTSVAATVNSPTCSSSYSTTPPFPVCTICTSTDGNNCNGTLIPCKTGNCQTQLTFQKNGDLVFLVKSCYPQITCSFSAKQNDPVLCDESRTNKSSTADYVCTYCCDPGLSPGTPCNGKLYPNVHSTTTFSAVPTTGPSSAVTVPNGLNITTSLNILTPGLNSIVPNATLVTHATIVTNATVVTNATTVTNATIVTTAVQNASSFTSTLTPTVTNNSTSMKNSTNSMVPNSQSSTKTVINSTIYETTALTNITTYPSVNTASKSSTTPIAPSSVSKSWYTKPTSTICMACSDTQETCDTTYTHVMSVCMTCLDTPETCDTLYAPVTCDYPNNYCINFLKNSDKGEITVNRTCGDINTCYREWFQGSSDNDKCQQYRDGQIITVEFECTYCCIKDNCNQKISPDRDTLYNDV